MEEFWIEGGMLIGQKLVQNLTNKSDEIWFGVKTFVNKNFFTEKFLFNVLMQKSGKNMTKVTEIGMGNFRLSLVK